MVEKTTIRKSVSTCGKPPKVTRPTEFKQKRDLTNNEIKIIQFAKKINNSGSDQRISGAILAGLFWSGSDTCRGNDHAPNNGPDNNGPGNGGPGNGTGNNSIAV